MATYGRVALALAPRTKACASNNHLDFQFTLHSWRLLTALWIRKCERVASHLIYVWLYSRRD